MSCPFFHGKTFCEVKWLLKWFEWMFTNHVQFGIDPQNIQSQHFQQENPCIWINLLWFNVTKAVLAWHNKIGKKKAEDTEIYVHNWWFYFLYTQSRHSIQNQNVNIIWILKNAPEGKYWLRVDFWRAIIAPNANSDYSVCKHTWTRMSIATTQKQKL